MKASPAERLEQLAALYLKKNAEYGAAYEDAGAVLAALFPEGVWLTSPQAFVRFALVCRIADKLTRYTKNFTTGHPDSLDDLAVLAQILRTVDDDLPR